MAKIGLEVHGYLLTKEKLFCMCNVNHGKKYAKPNTNICPICTGQPGSKPMRTNFEAVKKSIQIALLLGCKINRKIPFMRKHYSWPDLPNGFQSTMSGPHAITLGVKGTFLGIGIRECHLESDPAQWNPENGEIDYNRSGSPLIEIVTEPSFSSSDEVIEWLKNLTAILNYMKIIDKEMGIKSDVNISIDGGKRVELKNINSFKKIKEAIEIEVKRQEKNLPKLIETRMYDEKSKTTKLMRTKENAIDYRFIAEPDLPVVVIDEKLINKIKKELPKTPQEKLKELVVKYKIPKEFTKILFKEIGLVKLFENVVEKIEPKFALEWVVQEFLSVVNHNKSCVQDFDINPQHFIKLLDAIFYKKISISKGKEILRKWVFKSFPPEEEIKKSKIFNLSEIKILAKEVLKENKKAMKDYENGMSNAINFLIGKTIEKSKKRVDYKSAKKVLESLLK